MPAPSQPVRRRSARLLAGLAAIAAVSGLPGGVARAHTDVEYTVPAADEQVAEAVTNITVAFEDPVSVVGAGFEVFTPQQETVQPEVFSEDQKVFLLTMPEPLVGGAVGVRYSVAAEDGHILEDSFSFTVLADSATVTTTPGTGPAVVATAPATAPVTAAPSDDGGSSGTGIVIGVVAAAVLGGVAFFVLRSRVGGSTPS